MRMPLLSPRHPISADLGTAWPAMHAEIYLSLTGGIGNIAVTTTGNINRTEFSLDLPSPGLLGLLQCYLRLLVVGAAQSCRTQLWLGLAARSVT